MDHNTYRYLIMTTDPVHIGTGGMRLGRVDNTIVREPGTNLPKIPGTALHGAIRAYAARRYGKPQCAGQGSKEGRKHCGHPTCPICYTFGSIQGEAGSFSGVVSITDARILLLIRALNSRQSKSVPYLRSPKVAPHYLWLPLSAQ